MDLPWIQTRSGKAFTPTAPRLEDLDIGDIAWSLAHQPRFKGHTKKPYTVAEHCVRMSYMVSEEAALWALLHDAAEAYIGDIPAPLKHLAPGLEECENKIMELVEHKWCPTLSVVQAHEVKVCDKWIVHEEAKVLMGPRPRPWFPQPEFTPRVPFPSNIEHVGMAAKDAFALFLDRFYELAPYKVQAA